jgi:hypothetical protein
MRKKREKIAFSHMTKEQTKVYSMVTNYAKKFREDIRFDPESDEILIVMEHMLISLKGEVVHILNSHGFYPSNIPSEAYEILVDVIKKEAHKDRRRLKNDVKIRINKFLNEASYEDDGLSTEFDEEMTNELNK